MTADDSLLMVGQLDSFSMTADMTADDSLLIVGQLAGDS